MQFAKRSNTVVVYMVLYSHTLTYVQSRKKDLEISSSEAIATYLVIHGTDKEKKNCGLTWTSGVRFHQVLFCLLDYGFSCGESPNSNWSNQQKLKELFLLRPQVGPNHSKQLHRMKPLLLEYSGLHLRFNVRIRLTHSVQRKKEKGSAPRSSCF